MKRMLLLCGALMILGASAASAAQGVNLAWGAGCWGNNPVNLETFACNANDDVAGPSIMTASFQLGADLPQWLTLSAIIDGQSQTGTLPDWWQVFNSGSCRASSLTATANFSLAPKGQCTDPWKGSGTGGIGAWQTAAYPPPAPLNVPVGNRTRAKVAFALTTSKTLTASVNYYAVALYVDYANTVAPATICAGCSTPVTFVLNEIQLLPESGLSNAVTITNALDNQCIFWQSNAVDCSLVPARNRTWGAVKSLYR